MIVLKIIAIFGHCFKNNSYNLFLHKFILLYYYYIILYYKTFVQIHILYIYEYYISDKCDEHYTPEVQMKTI